MSHVGHSVAWQRHAVGRENVLRHVERDLVALVLAKLLMGQDLSQIYERYH